jgi:poly(beta-D-mannuronate) lyase
MKFAVRYPAIALFSLAALALAGCGHLPPAPPPGPAMVSTTLVSPWDAKPVMMTNAPFPCGTANLITPDLTITNGQGLHGNRISEPVKQAIRAESGAPLRDLTHRVVAAADNFQQSGSHEAAQCVVTLLTAAANGHAMDGFMSSEDSWQEQNQALRATAIAWLKVRASLRAANALSPDDNILLADWMESIVRRERENAETGPCGKKICTLKNHWGLSVASASATVGIVANDHDLFQWAIMQYRNAVDSIDSRGMLHYDLHGEFALNFTIASTADLVQIAEFGEVNGEPLYAFDDGHLHVLVHTVARAIVDPAPFADAAGADQRQHPHVEAWQVSWASVYNRRFPDPVLTTLLQQVSTTKTDMWGGDPWTAQTN